ncbi:hypothetical protein CRYUN_Cryun14cG0025200 [Craigia yunnanensis]
MEEEEEKKFGETSVRSYTPEVAPVVEDRIGGSHQENVNFTGGEEAVLRNDNAVSQGVQSASLIGDEEQFEPLSLKNQNNSTMKSHVDQVDSNRSSNSDYERRSSGEFEEYSQHLTKTYGMEYDSSSMSEPRHDRSTSSPGPERQIDYTIKHSSSATCLDSVFYADSGYSPLGSPIKPKPKAAMPNVSPELLHLVDSAIMGKPESLDKLKNIVARAETFGSGEDTESIPFLVVDSLIATMG